ncbi:MAG: DMT family transporter [Defluviitaleaceae bacterium]|nr:DMT family transporter [Defluviitaleaceae bacterium]
MYYILSLLAGVLISAMVAFNGGLTEAYGVYSATVLIHVVGLAFILIILLVKRESPFIKRHAWFLYTGGAIGVLTVLFNNLAFGRISVSAILALSLFGQSICGLIVDQYGLLGMPRHPFQKRKIAGLVIVLVGSLSMITSFEAMAVIVSIATGATIVVSRTLNARLAELTSVRVSTFYNYLLGLSAAVLIFPAAGLAELAYIELNPSPWIYLGGVLGVGVILIFNTTVTKISAFYLTLLSFIGQVFAGILIDVMISRELSVHNLIGGVLVTIGLCANLVMDRRKTTQ